MRTPKNEDSALVDHCLKKMMNIYGLEHTKELAKKLRTTTANFALWRFRGHIPERKLQKFELDTGQNRSVLYK